MATTTAAQRREEARDAYDSFLRDSSAMQLLDPVGSKKYGMVRGSLAEAPLRYSDIGRAVAGAGPRMLTRTLRPLERGRLVSRTVTPDVPVRVTYALTPLGRSRAALTDTVQQWADGHMDEVFAARGRNGAAGSG